MPVELPPNESTRIRTADQEGGNVKVKLLKTAEARRKTEKLLRLSFAIRLMFIFVLVTQSPWNWVICALLVSAWVSVEVWHRSIAKQDAEQFAALQPQPDVSPPA